MAKTEGRERVLDATKQREICALVSVGTSMRKAAQYVGCCRKTIEREAKRNPEFAERLQRSRVSTQLGPLQSMRQAVQSDWRAAAWMLERTDPDRFGRRTQSSVGAKELRALARDLMAIFRDEINHPELRDRILGRVQATINYALRHAWDRRRSGSSLGAAMKFFERKDAKASDWPLLDCDWYNSTNSAQTPQIGSISDAKNGSNATYLDDFDRRFDEEIAEKIGLIEDDGLAA